MTALAAILGVALVALTVAFVVRERAAGVSSRSTVPGRITMISPARARAAS